MACIVTSAEAATPERFFKETFGSAAQPTFGAPQGLAIDESDGDLLVMDRASGTISRYTADGSPDDFSALGTNVISEAEGQPLVFGEERKSEIAVDESGTATDGNIYVTNFATPGAHSIDIFARSGAYLGKLTEAGGSPFAEACGVTVDPTGAVYVGDDSRGVEKFIPTGNVPTNADFDPSFVTTGGKPCALAAGVTGSAGAVFAMNWDVREVRKVDASSGSFDYLVVPKASGATTVSVIPSNGNILVAKASGEVSEYDASGTTEPRLTSTFNAGAGIQGVAGTLNGVYVSKEAATKISVFGPVLPFPELEPATSIGTSGMTLHGVVHPEGLSLSACKFEYGLASNAGFEAEVPCEPLAALIPSDFIPHQVSANIVGLQKNGTYRVRLTATNTAVTLQSEARTFTTAGAPQISEIRARDASQSSAVLEAKVNPSGFDTTYRFEWGPSMAYGNSVPAQAVSAGEGSSPVLVTADLSDLVAATRYHYRIVAINSQGRTETSDQEVETLNACGLPDLRCFELVSPREPGPVSRPGLTSNEELNFQSSIQPGSLMYSVANGLPGTTKGAEVLYHAVRGQDGWAFAQFSPPIVSRGELAAGDSRTSATKALSADLSCGVVVSNQVLTSDPGTRLVVESGGSNLYRRNPDGSYTAITKLPPVNASDSIQFPEGIGLESYFVYGYSEKCRKVVFRAPFRYPNVPAVDVNPSAKEEFLYEWDEGTLRNVGVVPTGSGEAEVAATLGDRGSNVVSEDGSRVFFSAIRKKASNPEEVGKVGLFVRENGLVTRDLSQSETTVADQEPLFQYATPDGTRVFFIANAGLTPVSSPSGRDLYEYDLDLHRLIDLSVTSAAEGAEVGLVSNGAPAGNGAFLGASRDGRQVYFAARGELVPGRGRSFTENVAANTFSIYGERNGIVSFAGVIREEDLRVSRSARVSADGRYLLYQTAANVTGYDSGGVQEAYLFDARSTGEPIVCVSCRQDGQPSVEPIGNSPLGDEERQNPFHPRARLVVRDGQAMVFFTSFDPLAPKASAEDTNLYEWAHGQVFLITAEPPNLQSALPENGTVKEYIEFAGAGADGSDLYFTTPAALTWEEKEQRIAVYDARINGGFPQPPAPAEPCASDVEGACQGPSASPSAVGNPSSSTFVGPGNKKPPCKKGFVRKKGKCVKKHGGKKQKGSGKKRHGPKGKGKQGSKGKSSKGHRAAKQKGSRAARHANADQGVGK